MRPRWQDGELTRSGVVFQMNGRCGAPATDDDQDPLRVHPTTTRKEAVQRPGSSGGPAHAQHRERIAKLQTNIEP